MLLTFQEASLRGLYYMSLTCILRHSLAIYQLFLYYGLFQKVSFTKSKKFKWIFLFFSEMRRLTWDTSFIEVLKDYMLFYFSALIHILSSQFLLTIPELDMVFRCFSVYSVNFPCWQIRLWHHLSSEVKL